MLHNWSDIRQWQILSSGQTLLSDQSFHNILQVYCELRSSWPCWLTDHLQSAQILCPYSFKDCCWNSCILLAGFVIWIVFTHLSCYWLVKIGWYVVSGMGNVQICIFECLLLQATTSHTANGDLSAACYKKTPKTICNKRTPQREELESRSFTHCGRSRGENAQLSPVYVPAAKRSQMLNQLVV